MKKENKTNKPFYKKWWFIAAAIIIVIAAASGGGDEELAEDSPEQVETSAEQKSESKKELTAEEKAAAEQKEKELAEAKAKKEAEEKAKKEVEAKKIKSGTYKVGSDIPAGEYLVFAKSMAYIESASNSSGQLESIIFNDNLNKGSHSYVTLNAGEYFKMNGAEMYPVADAPSVIPSDGLYKDGMYKVGQDIPAGEYKVMVDSAIGYGYLEVSSDSSHQLTSIITNDNIEADTYITVQNGQYLKLNRTKIQK